jgi:transposase
MYNASFHWKNILNDLVRHAGSEIIFLPAYSPDLNPIEKTWANMKSFLRNYASRFDTLQDAIKDYFKAE